MRLQFRLGQIAADLADRDGFDDLYITVRWGKNLLLFLAPIFIVGILGWGSRLFFLARISENPPTKSKHERSGLGKIIKEFIQSESERKIIAYLLTYAAAYGVSVPFQIKFLKTLGFGDGVVLAAAGRGREEVLELSPRSGWCVE